MRTFTMEAYQRLAKAFAPAIRRAVRRVFPPRATERLIERTTTTIVLAYIDLKSKSKVPLRPRQEFTGITIACMADAFFREDLGPFQPPLPMFDVKPKAQAAVAALQRNWRISLWVDCQFAAARQKSGSARARVFSPETLDWVKNQLCRTFDVSGDGLRKIRERSRKRLHEITSLQWEKAIEMIAGHLSYQDSIVAIRSAKRDSCDIKESSESVRAILDFLKKCSLSDLTGVNRYITEITQYGLDRTTIGKLEKVEQQFRIRMNRVRDRKIAIAENRLLHRLGKIAETFWAGSAWIFRFDEIAERLKGEIGHNSDLDIATGYLNLAPTQGIVGRVWQSKKPYILRRNPESDRFYVQLNLGTQSELATPILGPNEKRLGVLNLESSHPEWFSETDAIRLQSLAIQLAPDLIIYSALKGLKPEFGSWHYHDGWSLDLVFHSFCDSLRGALREAAGLKTAVMIWEYDHEKKAFWLRGTSGYDFEYSGGPGLPNQSFLGKVFRQGKPVRHSLQSALLNDYQRPGKAEAFDMKWLGAAPISWSGRAESWGVLAIYGFRETDEIDLELLLRFADWAGQAVRDWNGIRLATADAHTLLRMSRIPSRGAIRNETARDIIREIFEADGVSIFAAENGNTLSCISTTGLEDSEGRPVANFRDASYSLNPPEAGATVRLALHPGTVLRKTDASNEQEVVSPFGDTLEFKNKFRETVRSPLERRAFIGMGAETANVGRCVIRAIRSAGARPFRANDADLLKVVATTLLPFLENSETTKNPVEFTRFVESKPAQIDKVLAAICQFALGEEARRLGRNGLRLLEIRKRSSSAAAEQKTAINEFLSIGVSNRPQPERQTILKKDDSRVPAELPLASEWFEDEGYRPYLSLTAGHGERLLYIPFEAYILRSKALLLLEVAFAENASVNDNEVKHWVSLAQALTLTFESAAAGVYSDLAAQAAASLLFGPTLIKEAIDPKEGVAAALRVEQLLRFALSKPSFEVEKVDGPFQRWRVIGLRAHANGFFDKK